MANQTIEGCVDWTSGQVIFDGDACDGGDYTGCINWTGAHAGMVAVVVDEDNCDATYYGCVDWTSGKFELIIPDDCCSGDYETGGGDCDGCDGGTLWEDDFDPLYVKVVFEDVIQCEESTCSGQSTLSSTYYLKNESTWCEWDVVVDGISVVWVAHNPLGGGAAYLTAKLVSGNIGLFIENGATTCSVSFTNYYTACSPGNWCAYEGTATVTWGAGIGQTQYDAQF